MGRILKTDFYRLFRGLAFYIFPAGLLMVLIFSINGQHGAGLTFSVNDILSDLITTMRYLTFIPVCMAITKLITGALVTVIYMVLTFLFVMISQMLAGYKIVLGNPGELLLQVGYWFLICMAVVAFMELIHEATQSSALGYIMSIMIWTGMVEEILIMVVTLINSKWDITEYTLIYGFLIRGADLFSFVRTMIYLVVFAGLAIFIAKKKDVKV